MFTARYGLNFESGKVFLSTPRRNIGGVEVYLHLFLTSALDRSECLTARPGRC